MFGWNFFKGSDDKTFPAPGKFYKIISCVEEKHKFVLDVSKNDKIGIGKTIIYEYRGNDNQKFYFQGLNMNENGIIDRFAIFCKHQNKLLAPHLIYNTAIQHRNPSYDSSKQYWKIIPANQNNQYFIQSSNNLRLDVCGCQGKSQTQVILHQNFHGNKNQIWKIEPAK